jgi:hypothetical protein
VRHHRCYRLLAWTPRALATAQWASRTEDHSGSTLSWCRSRAHVQGGPRAEPIADDFRDAEGELEQGGSPSANLQGSWRRRLQALNFPRGPVTCLPTFIHVCVYSSSPWVVYQSCQQVEMRCRAPSFASATEKSRAAVVYPACPTARGRLLVAHHTSIDRCCASNDGRGGDGVAMPAASLSHSRGADTATC